ncbi:hypothetical protein OOK31_18350 [Streptomyces sp. NBC_00249]|uniref:hypothetical protein n=1 Tax=Streptomyces sp. NBC_00249 TaxID=2975690 RepID=UPI00224EE811|nr:hypothetical protein [Streptomyces sp. NBC_00249]MCX5195826.1 hypothetical protein [Streptomyces sp. NBC_00249]
MGSLRNPVGPLPSSIYWRRRAVLASVAALIALLAVWVVSSGGGSSSTNGKGGGDGSGPTKTITPGPSGSGPAISQAPGGRAETGTGTGSSGGTGKNGEPGSGGPGSGSTTGNPASGGTSGTAEQVPADSPLPNCAPGVVRWEVKSVKNEYETNEKPRIELLARNTSGSSCKFGLGPKQVAVMILQASNAKAVWSSADCVGETFLKVPAQSETKHAVEWDRKFSAADQCQTPPAGSAAPDTYVVEVRVQDTVKAQTSFVLKRD